MKLAASHKIIGISVAVLFTGAAILSIRQRIRDKKTSDLLSVIQSKISTTNVKITVEKAFDVNYLDKVLQHVSNTVLVVKNKVALDYAKQIHQAWGSWILGGDDEAKVYAVFRKLQDKVQVSQVAKAYQDTYSNNLIDVLRDRFSKSEIKEVLSIVEGLPNYRKIE